MIQYFYNSYYLYNLQSFILTKSWFESFKRNKKSWFDNCKWYNKSGFHCLHCLLLALQHKKPNWFHGQYWQMNSYMPSKVGGGVGPPIVIHKSSSSKTQERVGGGSDFMGSGDHGYKILHPWGLEVLSRTIS